MAIRNNVIKAAGASVVEVWNGEIDPRNQVMYRIMYPSAK